MKRQMTYLKLVFIFSVLCGSVQAHEVLVNTQDGETFAFDIDPEARLKDVQENLAFVFEGRKADYVIEIPSQNFVAAKFFAKHGGYLGFPRDYMIPATPEQKADIRYILITLANRSLFAIAGSKKELEAAGDRIDRVHPLRFLETVFTEEELKVAIRNVHAKGEIWRQFFGGLKESLNSEVNIGNITDAHISDFSRNVKINPELIAPWIKSTRKDKWDRFIEILMDKVPRNDTGNRYDDC